jgi:hypothetical protein
MGKFKNFLIELEELMDKYRDVDSDYVEPLGIGDMTQKGLIIDITYDDRFVTDRHPLGSFRRDFLHRIQAVTTLPLQGGTEDRSCC